MNKNLQDFIVPDWIKKGVLARGMFEPIDYKFWHEDNKQIVLDAGSILRTIENSIYPNALKKYDLILSNPEDSSPSEIMDAEEKINERENELFMLKSILTKYIQIIPAHFNYSSRYREDNSATRRLHLDGTPTKTLQHEILIQTPNKKHATFHSLFWYSLGIQLAVGKDLSLSQMNEYDGFLTLADQICAVHALTYYAGIAEIKHNIEIDKITNDNNLNPLERNLRIKSEDELYGQTVSKIKYNWEVWRPTLVQAIVNKTPLKLKIVELPIESQLQEETLPKTTTEFYNTAINNITKISEQIRKRAKEKGIELSN